MDTSKEYIKMCEKAEEIQILRQWKYYDQDLHETTRKGNFISGDVYIFDDVLRSGEKALWILGDTIYPPSETKTSGKSQSVVGYDEGDAFDFKKLVWLPRQDQLQEMVTNRDVYDYSTIAPDRKPRLDNFLCAFEQFYRKQEGFGTADGFNSSMEQLWLAFVMKEKYGKAWNSVKKFWE